MVARLRVESNARWNGLGAVFKPVEPCHWG